MSKEGTSLRLLGSPVNLSYRNRKKDKLHIRNRPRSALQNSYFAADKPQNSKRPFSADTHHFELSRGRIFQNSFGSDLTYLPYDCKSTEAPITIKTLTSDNELVEHKINFGVNGAKEKDFCNNSDYGSEDTYVSLGTKIKAKAQAPKNKHLPNKNNFLKYRSIPKKSKRFMEGNKNDDDDDSNKTNNAYGMEVKITGRQNSASRSRSPFYQRPMSPSIRQSNYDAYAMLLEETNKITNNDLTGRVSFGKSNIESDVASALEAYTHRLSKTKQQLSLVEEESSHDLESMHSLNLPSSRENVTNSGEDTKKETENDNFTGRNTYTINNEEEKQKDVNDLRTYNSFYDDFSSLSQCTSNEKCKSSSSAIIHTDSSSKDSGYQETGCNEEKRASSNIPMQYNANEKVKASKSSDSCSKKSKNENSLYNTFPLDKNQWAEPTNHSRLLYKDFFLRKEGGDALPPQNSPRHGSLPNVSGLQNTSGEQTVTEQQSVTENLDYPPYLRNSTTKAYTSKVIEDYKKELEAINSLHELTLKDIKTDSISPTPLNIDTMFEINSVQFANKSSSENFDDKNLKENKKKSKNIVDSSKKDITKTSTKELIQNYLKVKNECTIREFSNRNTKNLEKKSNTNSIPSKSELNNRTPQVIAKSPIPVSVRNHTFRSSQSKPPLSARLESKQKIDVEIESWMSLTAPSPRIYTMANEEITEVVKTNEIPSVVENIEHKEKETAKSEVRTEPLLPTNASYEKLKLRELSDSSTVLDIFSMLKEIESFGDNPVPTTSQASVPEVTKNSTNNAAEYQEAKSREELTSASEPKDNFMEIFEFLEKVEQSANDALSVVTSTTPQTIPKLEALLKLPQTELAQRLVTASLQLEERSCCIALLQESLANHKEQMINKVSSLEKQSLRNIGRVKQECENAIKRHQGFIDQLINDKKTLNHRIEQLVDERRTLEERWKRAAHALEERYKLELRNQHDKMAAAQQVARQRWVRQKAEKIKELTVKGLEGELREMAERQQKEVADLRMSHAEQMGRVQSKHAAEMEELRRTLEGEKEEALIKERQLASARLEKQILELELTYQEQRNRLMADMRAENERLASELNERECVLRQEIVKWREEQEKIIENKRAQAEQELKRERESIEEKLKQKEQELKAQFEQFKKNFEAEQQMLFKKKVTELSMQHKQERDREIEKAIESMEAEAQAGRKELQDALRRNKEQYEMELRELAETEQATLRRYQDAQARIRQTENRLAELELMIGQLETRNKILTEKNMQLESQGEDIRKQCEETWRQHVTALEKEMESMKKTHEEQMHQLYAKVKVAVARKDSAIQALTRESAKYQEKIAVLEQKLQQQRKDFLKQK